MKKLPKTIAGILSAIFYRGRYNFSYVRLLSKNDLTPGGIQSQLKIKAALKKARF
ncbi:MAG TPA: hypothetical protein VHP12_08525 [Chitinophagaceae bacterium]|nr:hypothetical protein [Chitinophagaceae bacterium]